jgi:hypothetical protein
MHRDAVHTRLHRRGVPGTQQVDGPWKLSAGSLAEPPPASGAGLQGRVLHLNKNPPQEWEQLLRFSRFSRNALGTPGNAKRRFFYGPGADNYDMAAAKKLPLTESKALLFRVEAFNVFNHTQFDGPSSVDGNIGSSSFGNAISAAAPRILRGALKLNF